MKFTVDMENTWMDNILNGGADPAKGAADWLKANPGALDTFLAGVTTFDGQPGVDAVKKSVGI
jgi:glycine betaine/proline transport system substrate-binding protein